MVKPRGPAAASLATLDDDPVTDDAHGGGDDGAFHDARTPPSGTLFDLAEELDYSGTARLELLRANGEPALHPQTGEPVWIELHSCDSDVFRQAQRSMINRRAARLSRKQMLVEEGEAEAVSLLAKCTVAWGNVAYKGRPLPCTYENARMVYASVPIVREQVDRFINNRENFSKS